MFDTNEKDPRVARARGSEMQREARRLRVLFARYREHTSPRPTPPPLNQLAISPARFVSPATNKQQNERGPISRQQRLLEKRARFLIPSRLLSAEIYLLRPLPRARHPTGVSSQIRIGSLSPPVGYILIGIVKLARDGILSSEY